MMLSLIFIVGFFSLLLLPITCLSILSSLEPQHLNINDHASDKPHPMSIWRLLVSSMLPGAACATTSKATKGKDKATGDEADECRVCLCEVEEGEKISDLPCNHLFHKVCLDAWIGSGHSTCPLCRGRVFSPDVVDEGAGSLELLVFQFSSFAGSRRARREGSWWIR